MGQGSYPVSPAGHRSYPAVPWDSGETFTSRPLPFGCNDPRLPRETAKALQADPPPSGCNAPGLSRETGRPLQADPPLGVTPPGFFGITARPLQEEEEEEDEGVTPVGHRTYPVTPVVHRPMSHGRCPTAACLTAQGEGGGGGRGGDFVVDVGRLSSPSPPSVVGRRRRRRRRCRRRRGS